MITYTKIILLIVTDIKNRNLVVFMLKGIFSNYDLIIIYYINIIIILFFVFLNL